MNDRNNLSELCIKSIPLVKIYRATRAKYPMNNKGRSHHGLLFPLAGTEKYSFSHATVNAAPGTVLATVTAKTREFPRLGPIVKCGDTALMLTEVKPEGGSVMDGAAVARGRAVVPGEDRF